MSSKSRVILYAELRKKISDIDQYSFETRSVVSELEKKAASEKQDTEKPDSFSGEGIKRNTFSMSIDELMKENNQYDSKAQEKETQERLSKLKKEERHQRKAPVFTIVLWTSIAVVLVMFIVLLVLILTEVI